MLCDGSVAPDGQDCVLVLFVRISLLGQSKSSKAAWRKDSGFDFSCILYLWFCISVFGFRTHSNGARDR